MAAVLIMTAAPAHHPHASAHHEKTEHNHQKREYPPESRDGHQNHLLLPYRRGERGKGYTLAGLFEIIQRGFQIAGKHITLVSAERAAIFKLFLQSGPRTVAPDFYRICGPWSISAIFLF
jgi:hypothetical protein